MHGGVHGEDVLCPCPPILLHCPPSPHVAASICQSYSHAMLCMHRYFYACIYSVFPCYPCDSLAPVMLPPLPPRLLPTLSEVKGRVT